MAKLTKASFARAKKALGIKKVTKKNIGRIAKKARGVTKLRSKPRKARTTRRKTRKTTRRRRKVARRKGKRGNKTLSLGVVTLGLVGGDLLIHQGGRGQPLYEAKAGNWGRAGEALLQNAKENGVGLAAKLLVLKLGKSAIGNVRIIKLGKVVLNAL